MENVWNVSVDHGTWRCARPCGTCAHNVKGKGSPKGHSYITWSNTPMIIDPMEKKALGQNFNVHLLLGEEELYSIIKSLLPMDLNGVNWGLRHVQGSLAKQKF